MEKKKYEIIEKFMCDCMKDSAHDREHVYRVLYNALDIASYETEIDYDILVAACLLHDICRPDQIRDPGICHARAGAVKAHDFLKENGFSGEFADNVSECIRTHRFRSDDPPKTVEARVLFDADKLDVAGTVGIARTLMYQGATGEPLYTLNERNEVSDGAGDTKPSFFQEYRFKLENIYLKFYTDRGRELALQRKEGAREFYETLYREISLSYDKGRELLFGHIISDV